MTQYPATRTATSSPPSSGGIDVKTLAITAASSAAAAYACSRVWASGTLAAAAFTPVLVAVIREALDRSTEVVAKAVPVRGVVRSAEPEGGLQPLRAASPGWAAEESPLVGEDPADRVAQPGEIAYHRAGGGGRKWRIAIVTGLLGFLIAAFAFTVPELVAGRSASGGGRDTTLFGGKQREISTPAVTTTTTTAPGKTVTTAPQKTVTVPPQTVTTPAPVATTPVPQESTTTPAPTTTPTEPPAVEEPPPAEVPPG